MKQLDTLIIHPSDSKKIYQELANDYSAIEPPLWAGLLATYIRNRNFSVKIFDSQIDIDYDYLNKAKELEKKFNIFDFSEHKIEDYIAWKVLEYNPKLVVIPVFGQQPSSSTQLTTFTQKIVAAIKSRKSWQKILVLGNHISALPEQSLKELDCDYVAIGEGCRTIIDLLEEKPLNEVRGLLYFDYTKEITLDTEFTNDEERYKQFLSYGPIATNLTEKELNEEMNECAWDLLDLSKYRAHNWHCFENPNLRTSYVSIYTSLGCQFFCNFCMIHSIFNEHKMRLWSPENIIKQIDKLYHQYGIRNIKIADEMFMMYKKQVHAICDLLIEKDYKDLNIWCYARIDTVREDYLPKLKKAGIKWLALGIESGSKYVRDGADKHFTENDIKEVVKGLQDADINVIGNYIFGLPHDTLETMQDTLNLALELKTEMANFYCSVAYPGSELYNNAIKENVLLPEKWEDYSQHGHNFIPTANKNLTSKQILEFRDNAFNIYFTNEEYLESIEKKFGTETRKHIEDMSKIKLRRQLL
jgi:radical SAM superfamily enzyme YgiQ (UPF0313 family)